MKTNDIDIDDISKIAGRKVLLYSGGLDSHILARLWKPDVCLYVHTRSRYGALEFAHLRPPPHGELVVDFRLTLEDVERKDLIVPHRNAFLVLVAAYYGTEIALAATAGDRSTDKDNRFAAAMESLLDHIYQPQHWTGAGLDFHVELPVKDKTKRQLVREWVASGGDPAELARVVSCYDGASVACGRCKACARKWVALYLEGIECAFDSDPALYFTPDMVAKARTGDYRGDAEDADMIEALARRGLTEAGQ